MVLKRNHDRDDVNIADSKNVIWAFAQFTFFFLCYFNYFFLYVMDLPIYCSVISEE